MPWKLLADIQKRIYKYILCDASVSECDYPAYYVLDLSTFTLKIAVTFTTETQKPLQNGTIVARGEEQDFTKVAA